MQKDNESMARDVQRQGYQDIYIRSMECAVRRETHALFTYAVMTLLDRNEVETGKELKRKHELHKDQRSLLLGLQPGHWFGSSLGQSLSNSEELCPHRLPSSTSAI